LLRPALPEQDEFRDNRGSQPDQVKEMEWLSGPKEKLVLAQISDAMLYQNRRWDFGWLNSCKSSAEFPDNRGTQPELFFFISLEPGV